MSDTKKLQPEAPASKRTLVAILAAVAVASVMLMIGSVSNPGSVEANAAALVLSAPDRSASPEEHGAFIRQGHTRAALEGEDSPLPPTF